MHFVQLHVDASERVRSLRAEQARPLTPQEHGNLVREWIHYHRAWRSLGEGTSPPIDARDRTLATFQELTSTIDEMEHQIIQDVLMLFHREVLPCIR
jgi:hypothetical protein